MSNLDEARYGRACLLILNICPFVLRRVISDYYTGQGSLSIQDFLEKNKHDLFHLLRKRCCCRPQQSSITPINNSQWDSLYMRNGSSCRNGLHVDCPCKYDAKFGITTSVMDITLCCLFIKNICHGITINMAHVDTIREVRNNLIHAGSANLNGPTFIHYWKRVENAIIDIALNVSTTLHSDTKKMVKDLENQSMNTAELAEELKRLIVDEKRIEDLEKNVHDITVNLTRIKVNKNQTAQKVTEIEETVHQSTRNIKEVRGDMSLLKTAVVDQGREISGLQQGQIIPMQQDLLEHDIQLDNHTRQIDGHAGQMDDHARQIDDHSRQIDDHAGQIGDHSRQIDEHSRRIDDHSRQIDEHTRQKYDHSRQINELSRQIQTQQTRFQQKSTPSPDDISKLKQRLIKINVDIAKVIPISPLQDRGDKEMPIELLYTSVVILEDAKYQEKGCNSSQQNKNVSDLADIFIKDDNLVENMYMLGDAAHGKTTYCIWLLKKWCDAQHTDGMGSYHWAKVLKRFDFVFLLQFRHVNPNRASVIDMICQDLFRKETDFHATIRHVLSSDKYRSLIIMDGLDEWNPYEETKNRLTCKGMPNTEGVASSVSCFISMRPWVFPTILKMVKVSDRVIEIHGLSETGMKKVIENVLLYHYKLKDDPSKYTAIYNKIVRNLENESLKSFMQIPLLAVVCVQIWYTGKQVGDSMASFYAVMLNMLIERADQKHKLQTEHSITLDDELPEILSVNEYIEDFISTLLKLGNVAYKGLLSKETSLVFQKRKLEKEIGVRELQFALDVGLISQKEAPSTLTKNVSVHFFHKSIQEFLAVIYIVTKKEVSDLFCNHLSNVKVIMDLSNVIMFICGMCPSLGRDISQRVVSVTDSDTEICNYRESLDTVHDTVKELYKLQVNWYRELQYGQTYSPVTQTNKPVIQTDMPATQTDSPITQTDSPVIQTNRSVTQTDRRVTQTDRPVTQTDSSVIFHISDVYLTWNSNTETVRMTRELLSDHHVDIRSLYFLYVPTDGKGGITNTVLDDFLSNTHNTRSLVMLYINGYNTGRFVPTLYVPILRCLYLNTVTINTHLCDNICPQLLTDMSQLRVLNLWDVRLGEGGMGLSPDMVHIQRIQLSCVTRGEGGLGLSPDMVNIELIELVDVRLGEGGLGLSPDMIHIKKVLLKFVEMPEAEWGKFVRSVSNIQHSFNVVLVHTNIDDASVTKIRSSSDFTVTWDSVGEYGRYLLHFTRICPLSQLT